MNRQRMETVWGVDIRGVLWGCEVGNSPLEMFGTSVVHPTRHMAMFLGHMMEKQGSAACLPPEHMLRPLSRSTARGLPCRRNTIDNVL